MWTHFWDMHSGGRQKLEWSHIYIQAPETEATAVFYSRFDRNPSRVTCTCCGEDYAIDEEDDLKQATGYQRHCAYVDGKYVEVEKERGFGRYRTLEQYLDDSSILVIYSEDISPDETKHVPPSEGYVWV